MSECIKAAAAPPTATTSPAFEELAADPEIAALLDFEPVPRKVQAAATAGPRRCRREFIAGLRDAARRRTRPRQMGK